MTAALRVLLRLVGLPTRIAAVLALTAVLGVLAGCSGTSAPPSAAVPMPAPTIAAPVRIDVESIGARSTLVETGQAADGTLEVPPVEQPGQASWYRLSPRPGEIGPAVVLGHVNGGGRDGVFARLDDLEAGARVTVTRADGSAAAFDVYRVQLADKAAFPTSEVYSDTPGPELRLITCGGEFDSAARSYRSNVIAYAREVPA